MQVISNLVANAIYAMPAGGLLSMSVEDVEQPTSGVELTISDNGQGSRRTICRRYLKPFSLPVPRSVRESDCSSQSNSLKATEAKLEFRAKPAGKIVGLRFVSFCLFTPHTRRRQRLLVLKRRFIFTVRP